MNKVIIYFYTYYTWDKQFTVKELECEEKEKTYKNTTKEIFSKVFINKNELDVMNHFQMYSLKNDLDYFKEKVISTIAHQIDINQLHIQYLNDEIAGLQQDIENIKNSMNNKE